MAAASQFPVAKDVSVKTVPAQVQKKIIQDVQECVIQLKTDFFEHNQPITDDSVVLQRFCAKFEHLLQVGMKESKLIFLTATKRTSLMGRKKDYWDYFCQCLGSAKGFNDGIRYVKSLGENKTSLGRGRAFLRFCLVHQRLADTIQQCVVHEKTQDWFLPSSVLCRPGENQSLINSLYDLNSLHFDLAPRGYDLDTSWPSFSNKKRAGSGSWNVPISRRSSFTSMDSVSQLSMSIENSGEIDRLSQHNFEQVQNSQADLLSQIEALKKEKEEATHLAWEKQGELQSVTLQLTSLQEQHNALQDRYKELDVSYMKVRLEKEHTEKVHADQVKLMQDQVRGEEAKKVSRLQEEEDIWKKEVKEEGERKQREIDRLRKELNETSSANDEMKEVAEQQSEQLQQILAQFKIVCPSRGYGDCMTSLSDFVQVLEGKVEQLSQENQKLISEHQDEISEKSQQLSHLEGRLVEMERSLKDTQDSLTLTQNKVTTSTMELEKKREMTDSLRKQEADLSGELSALKERFGALEQEVEEKQKKISEMESEKVSVESGSAQLLQRLEEAEKERNGVKEKLGMTEQELKELKEENEEKRKEIARLKGIEEVNAIGIEAKDEEIQILQDRIEEKERSMSESRIMIKDLKTELAAAAQERQEKIEELEEQLRVKITELNVLNQEAEQVRQKNAELLEQLSNAETEVSQLRDQCGDLNGKVSALEGEMEALIIEKKKEEERVKEIENEKEGGLNREREIQKSLEEMKEAREKLQAALSGSETEKEDLKTELNTLKADRENIRREMDAEKSRMIGLLKESEGVKRSECEKSEKISQLMIEVEELKQASQEVGLVKDREIERLTDELKEKEKELMMQVSNTDELKAKFESEISSLQQELEKKEAEWQENLQSKQNQLQELETKRHSEVAEKMEEIEKMTKDLSDKETEHSEKMSELQGQLNRLRQEVSEKDAMLSVRSSDQDEAVAKLASGLSSVTGERDLLASQMSAALEDTQQIKSQLTQTSEQLEQAYSQLEEVTKEKDSLQSEFVAMTEELTRAQNGQDDADRKLAELKASLQNVEDDLQDKIGEKRKLEQQLAAVQNELEEALQAKKELEQKVHSTDSQNVFSQQVLEESLTEAQNALDVLKSEKAELAGECAQLKETDAELRESIQKLQEERREIARQLEEREQSQNTSSSELAALKETLELERKNHNSIVESLNEELSALQFQLSAEQLQQRELNQRARREVLEKTLSSEGLTSTELEGRVNDLEIIIQQLEEELAENKTHMDANVVQVQKLEKELLSKKTECDNLCEKFSNNEKRLQSQLDQIENLETQLAKLQETSQKHIEDRDIEITALKSDNKQIRKKLTQLIKDKDNLWQKTDQLVDEQKRKASDRWQDNSMVTHCPQCNTEFSLFVRKHHCRLCGRIYCWACSDFWLDVAHSHKKARVCGPCHDHHTNLDALKTSMSQSLVLAESDNEDGEEEDEHSEKTASLGAQSSGQGSTGSPSLNETDEGKIKHQGPQSGSLSGVEGPSQRRDSALSDVPLADEAGEEDPVLVLEDELLRSMTEYSRSPAVPFPPNMTSSITLSGEEIFTGEVNRQNEVWIKPGKTFAVPVKMDRINTTLHWEFTSHPKDIVFTVNYRSSEDIPITEAEEIVAPCKCDSHKQTVRGELTTKKTGLYTLIFDNTYSRMTSKKVHYGLDYKR